MHEHTASEPSAPSPLALDKTTDAAEALHLGRVSGQVPPVAALACSGALVVAAAIHAGAAWAHRNDGASHVTFFLVVTAGQLLLALLSTRRWTVPVRWLVALSGVAVSGVWLLSRTRGLPGSGTEEVGLADAIATAVQLVAAAFAVAGTRGLPVGARTSRPQRAPALGVALASVGLSAVAVPAAVAHGHHGADTTTITAVWAAAAGHTHGSDAAGRLTGNGIAQPAAAHCSPSRDEVARADDLVARTTLALDHWRDPQTALAEGFRPLGFEPNGVYHYINQSFQQDPSVLDPTKPESIVYGRMPSGDLRPIGVMFMMPQRSVDGPRPGGCLMVWHTHGPPFARVGEQSVQMVHVWTVQVPGGPFAHESGPDYARIYLHRQPVAAEEINQLLLRYLKPEGGRRSLTSAEIGAFLQLNAAGDPCGASSRKSLATLGVSSHLAGQLCDPLFSTPVPGSDASGGLLRTLFGGARRRGARAASTTGAAAAPAAS